jgi:hypothetical protein
MDDPPRERRRGSLLAIVLAGVVFLALLAGFFLIAIPLQPLALPAIGILLLFGFVGLFHYVVWGWWLSPMIHDEVDEDERSEERDRFE